MSNFDLRTRESRRSFLKKASYAAPVIVTFNAVPAFASHGSTRCCDNDGGDPDPFDPKPDPQPPGGVGLPPPSNSAIGDAPQGNRRRSQTGFGG
jgi:hypothetical protein